jgi:hypothetical protein
MTLLPEASFRQVTAGAGLMNINFAQTRPRLRPASKCGQISALAHISVMVTTCTAPRHGGEMDRNPANRTSNGVSPLIVDRYLRNAGGNCPRR